LSIRWKDIDFNLEHWRVSGEKSKSGQPMIIPLTKIAIEILLKRQAVSTSEFVFPGIGVKGHMTSPKAAWKRMVTRSGIENIRPHDLRRSLGSWMANTGASMVIIGGALGHKDQKSTQVYARLAVDPIKFAMETASDAIMKAAKIDI
jgi:integrase